MRRTGMINLAPIAAALLVLTAACGGADSDSAADDTTGGAADVSISDLDGRTFEAVAPDQVESPQHSLVSGTRIVVGFDGSDLSASAGCNGLGGEVEVVDGVLETRGGLIGTEMACEDDVMAQERWLSKLLMGSPEVVLDDTKLTLTSGDETLRLTETEGDGAPPEEPGDDDGVTSKN